jgi:hypothetical protein
MAYAIIQAGDTLYRLSSDGSAQALTLPAGVTLDPTKRARFAVLGRYVACVWAPSQNLLILPDLTVVPLVPRPPVSAPQPAEGTSPGLTGTYSYRETFRIYDAEGRLVSESPPGPPSISITVTDKTIEVSGCAQSEDPAVNARGEYRTVSGGTTFFQLLDLEGNTLTSYVDDAPDASLQLLPMDELGAPPGTFPGPGLELIVEWQGRLWAKPAAADRVDQVIYSEVRKPYAWPSLNVLEVSPIGRDAFGVTGFLARRDELLVLKRHVVAKITGNSRSTFTVTRVAEGFGCIAPDTAVVIRDVGYFLGENGVYAVSDEGVKNLTVEKVHPWFTTDDFFNRSRFPYAFAAYDPVRDVYRLFLAAAGSSQEDRWVELDLSTGEWWGPHRTDAFTPTTGLLLRNAQESYVSAVGGADGHVYLANQAAKRDGAATPIAYAVETIHSAQTPDIEKFWGELSVLTAIENGTLTVTPRVGDLDAADGPAITHAQSQGRQRHRRLGFGRFLQLRFSKSVVNEGVTLLGFEVPTHEVGRH